MYIYILYNWNIVASDVKLQYTHSSLIIQVSHECKIIGGMSLSSHWPPYPCTFFSNPPPFRFSFLSSILHPSSMHYNAPPYPSLEWSAKHRQPPPAISHPSSSTYLQSYNIWWGGQGKREKAGGEKGKEGAGVGRGEKDVKIWEGVEKRKIFARAAPRREEGNKGAGGERPTPCPPHHIWKQAMIHMVLNTPPPPPTHTTNTLSGLRPAVTTLKNV